MFRVEDVLQVKDGEAVQEIVRKHWISLVPMLALSFLLIVIPFFFLFPLFGWGILGVLIFIIALLIGIGIALRTFMLWDSNVLIVTTLRIVDVDQKGVFTRIVSDAALSTIQDISWMRRGIFETLFRTGSIRILTHGSHDAIEIDGIGHPDRLNDRINDLRHHRKSPTEPQKQEPQEPEQDDSREHREKLHKINKILETFSVEELTRIEVSLRARQDESSET